MSTPTIVLHIGAMKTGTSYMQSVLEQDKELLAQRGVYWPGASWKDQRLAVQDLLASGRRDGQLEVVEAIRGTAAVASRSERRWCRWSSCRSRLPTSSKCNEDIVTGPSPGGPHRT